MSAVEFPAMRLEVVSALESLADPEHQARAWGRVAADGSYDDLTLDVHLLYDDCQVLPDPEDGVGSVILADEVEPLRRVHEALNPLLDDLGDRPDADYLADPRWPDVVAAARVALDVVRRSAG